MADFAIISGKVLPHWDEDYQKLIPFSRDHNDIQILKDKDFTISKDFSTILILIDLLSGYTAMYRDWKKSHFQHCRTSKIYNLHHISGKLFADYCKSMLLSLLGRNAIHWTKSKSGYWTLLEIKRTSLQRSCWILSAETEVHIIFRG